MEEIINYSNEINSDAVTKVPHASILCLNKKRKLQAEQLGLPQPKHKCCDRSFASKYGFPSNANSEPEEYPSRCQLDGAMIDDDSDLGSAKDSNSFSGDADSIVSVSNESRINLEHTKACSCDQRCSSSANLCQNCFKTILYSLDSRSMTISSEKEGKSPYNVEVQSSAHPKSGLHTSIDYEEQLLDLGDHVDYNCSNDAENIEQYAEKELGDILYSSEVNLNNYVLSSGRWHVNQGSEEI